MLAALGAILLASLSEMGGQQRWADAHPEPVVNTMLLADANNTAGTTPTAPAGSIPWPVWLGSLPIAGGFFWWLLKTQRTAAPTSKRPSDLPTGNKAPLPGAGATPAAPPELLQVSPPPSVVVERVPAPESIPPSPVVDVVQTSLGDSPADTVPAPALTSSPEVMEPEPSLPNGILESPTLPASTPAAVPVTSFVTATSLELAQSGVEATKFDVGQTDLASESLASVDEGLPELPDGYGVSRIVLMPRDPQWAYAYWDVSNEHKQALRQQGGFRLALRFYDVTDVDITLQNPHSLQQYDCDEMARDWYLPVPVSDRDYIVEIGYLAGDGRWLLLARSGSVRIPPVYPSDWFHDQFLTLDWNEDLRGRNFFDLGLQSTWSSTTGPIYDQIFDLAQSTEAQRVAGSLYGSMQHVAGSMQQIPLESLSSYIFPSGIGSWALPTVSGLTLSGVGFSASAAPIRPRQFWLVADAELIVYGATEPDATVTIAGRPIQLSPDGTFRFQMAFPDGLIDYPILAVAIDGEQTRSIHMRFTRETPHRHTNAKDEATDEWLI
ncbi:hypothetical protein BST81_08805 [Leptolyngbya sp. 'hensonii']|nr:hypothetical protein BST81_08805 [Leptolyngbya sp. 'hensonii']